MELHVPGLMVTIPDTSTEQRQDAHRSAEHGECILMLIIGDDGDMFMVILIYGVVFCSSSSCT